MEEDFLKGKTLLVVDDEVDLRDIMASELEFMGANVFQAGNITAAKDILKGNKVDLIVSDIRMPGGTGVDLLDYVKSLNPSTPPVVLITGFADITIEDAFNRGAEVLLSKPFKLDDLIQVVERYTRPLDERFSESEVTADKELVAEFDDTLKNSISKKQFLIGRGGVALVLNTPRKKIEIGEALKFIFKFKDKEIKGIGICRWMKVLESQKVTIGIEFSNLPPEVLSFFKDYWQKHVRSTYIPIP